MKKGLIVSVNEGSVTYETGPNAILLSNVMIQNGSFSNLAEFPVLQMLYRQGMLLPNHPKNSGQKPLLIGSKEQINAQMKYIYRGNYGLASVEELADSGMSVEQANILMDMKLKFAFGKIHKTNELLDSIVVKNESTEIRDGLSISTDSLNHFTMTYKDEVCSIDLNLPANKNYESPYPLSFHKIRREYFSIIHSGEGDGWDVNRPCIASIIVYQGKIYLIDAGPNIDYSLKALGIGIDEIEGIFHTHSHDDHFVGLTRLMRSDHKIKYYASSLVRNSVSKKISALLSIERERFSDFFEIYDLKLDVWNNINGLEVKPLLSPHPVETNIFLFRSMSIHGYKTYAHFADIVSLSVLKGMIKGENGHGIDLDFYEKTYKNYLTKVNIKKIDIGGGMIHGDAKDFKEDNSAKIILAHTALALTDTQKSIGSNAPFGTVDVLIPARRDYNIIRASKMLISYFATVEPEDLSLLLNGEFVTFNPGSIMMKEHQKIKNLYLMIAGSASKTYEKDGKFYNNIPISGYLLGDDYALGSSTSFKTYRAESFVIALKIPTVIFSYFIQKHHLEGRYKDFASHLDVLRKSLLFQAEISSNILHEIAEHMEKIEYGANKQIPLTEFENSLLIVDEGEIKIAIGSIEIETIREGDFFNENPALFSKPSLTNATTVTQTVLYRINAAKLKNIPVVLWKIMEMNSKRYAKIMQIIHKEMREVEDDDTVESKTLLEAVNVLLFVHKYRQDNYNVLAALKNLQSVITANFNDQESQMILYHYADYKVHRLAHKEVLKLIKTAITHFEDSKIIDEIISKIVTWSHQHIYHDDRDYFLFLSRHGVR